MTKHRSPAQQKARARRRHHDASEWLVVRSTTTAIALSTPFDHAVINRVIERAIAAGRTIDRSKLPKSIIAGVPA